MRNIYLVLHKKIPYYIFLMHSYTVQGTVVYKSILCTTICIYASLYKTIYLYALYRAWQRLSTNYIQHLDIKFHWAKLFASRSLSSRRVSTVFRLQSSIVDNCRSYIRISIILLLGIAVMFGARGTTICTIIVYAIVTAIAELTAKATSWFDGCGALPTVVDQCHIPTLRHGFSHYMLSFAKLFTSPSNLDEYETMLLHSTAKL